jgi:hypothetical protein
LDLRDLEDRLFILESFISSMELRSGKEAPWIDEQTARIVLAVLPMLNAINILLLVLGAVCHLPSASRSRKYENAVLCRFDTCWLHSSTLPLPLPHVVTSWSYLNVRALT